ncbi:ABC transporter ATP-binding protein [Helcococcus kunzii]|uniref:ABC transporter ATP-binding protein n=1 Tax=Helcococcus kunzii TaxID=40091 RepID=UPI001BAEFB38|nr:ATP-binding cassette domain-containing protein [Helcococcus kunzii]MCT1796089.1 ATP-binding cassette domain-containing protein [Helcococcus kunzii]MCT1989455.1 ATP-binding cassette domain-containing protein [Helcococcus kunzii]QUY64423.1 ATP-binding cassette domain-containing protein [Helcococcus kunzii]
MELIKIENLSLEVPKQKILDDINFSIHKGQFTSINGPSGSGKSTILRILARLTKESSGNIYFEDKDMYQYEYTDYRKEVSYVIQNPQLFGETIRDNLSFPAKVRNQEFDENRAKSLLDRLGLGHMNLDKSVDSLSGGEKQRIGLIRNLMYPPKVLLLDEVTSSLDDDSSELVWDFLFEEAKKSEITLVWVSHDEHEQNMAEQKIYLKKGKMAKGEMNE